MSANEFPGRPGINAETLRAAGIRFSDTPEPGSIEILYHDLHGNPMGFCRWRLPRERASGQKYDQEPNTGTRAYVPPQFHSLAPGGDLVIVEGEFKALALIDAGIKAIGLPNFNTYVRAENGERQLLAGIADAINYTKAERILFLGDSDTATNFAFAVNALFLASKLTPLLVLLPRIAIGGPGKGIDDCREALGDQFPEFWDSLIETAEKIDLKSSPGTLAVRMLEREAETIKVTRGVERDKLARRIVRMAAECKDPLANDRIVGFAEKVLGYTRSAFKQAVQQGQTKATAGEKETKTEEGVPLAMTPAQWFAEKFPSLADEHGEAVLQETNKEGIVLAKDIGEDFLAATLGDKGTPDAPTVFVPTEGKFYGYSPIEGIYVVKREPVLIAGLSRLMLESARACCANCETQKLEFSLRDAAVLSGVLKKARGLLEVPDDYFANDLTKFIPCADGMLRLDDKSLLPFSPTYRRRNKLVVPFDPAAKCPMFLDTLMRPALDDDDLDSVQRWCGLVLIGENLAQKVLILTGTSGGGKGTFIRVLKGIIGSINLASLRTQLLGERFELGRFLGKTLLYGADVPENFLNQRGASVMKALTGGDPVTLEFKNSNESPSITCKFNIVVTCNSRLTVHLEGDTEAWRRRLCPIEYHKPKPKHVIDNLSQRILASEGPGVLNWMLEGLDKLRAEGWQLFLTARQQARVDNLLLESEGHAVFVRECLVRDAEGQLTVPDSFATYVEFCNQRGWTALTKNKFGALIGDMVVEQFGITLRHDILDTTGKPQRGWKGLKLIKPTGKTASEASDNQVSDGSDTLFQVQPAKKLIEEMV